MSDSNPPNDTTDESSVWNDARITAYVMGELSKQDAAEFEQSMAANDQLRAAVDQAAQVTDQLQTLFAKETPNTLDVGRREQILAASARSDPAGEKADQPSPLQNAMFAKPLVPWLLAAAASLLLLIGIVPALKQSQVAQHQTDAPELESGMTYDEALSESTAPFAGWEEAESLRRLGRNEPTSGELATVQLHADRSGSNTISASALATSMTDKSSLSLQPQPSGPAIVEDFEIAGEARGGQRSGAFPANPSSDVTTLETMTLDKFGAMPGRAIAAAPSPAAATAAPTTSSPILSKSLRSKTVRGIALSPVAASAAETDHEAEARVRRRIVKPDADGISEQSEAKLDVLSVTLDESLLPYTDGDRFDPIVENEFKQVREHPLSTFSIDVDTASYSKLRRTLVEGRLPRPDAVRIEELVNYFDYHYEAPQGDSEHPFSTDVTIASCPWNLQHRLARVAIQGKNIQRDSRPPCNLVFLLDTSGSMNQPNKLPLVIEGMKMLTKQLGKQDRVAIVVYAGSAGMVLDSTPAGKRNKITKALSQLSAGGSTNGGAGIQLAYATARDHFIKDGVNRVILCTDGDFNVGLSGTDELVRLIKEEASGGIFLTALGFGMGNHNDAMMEQISGKGNGNYAFIDTANEAHKVLVRQTDATLVTIAKDVKLQIEFNRRVVSQYRLIGYENRVMAKEDFNDDKKDAGEIGAGHQVTAFYELVMASEGEGDDDVAPQVDPLKYQKSAELTEAASTDEVMTVKLRYKQPDGDTSTLIELSANDDGQSFGNADSDFRFAAAVAAFAMQLRQSEFAGDWTLRNVLEVAEANVGADEFQLRSEFVRLVSAALRLKP